MQEDALSIVASASPASIVSCTSSLAAAADLWDLDLSEDEGLPPNQPVFTGLLPQALFKTLLHKAINTA